MSTFFGQERLCGGLCHKSHCEIGCKRQWSGRREQQDEQVHITRESGRERHGGRERGSYVTRGGRRGYKRTERGKGRWTEKKRESEIEKGVERWSKNERWMIL